MGFQKKIGWDGQSLDASTIPSAEDVIFSAGFYEGEGYCGRVSASRNGIAMHIGQKDPEILYRLREWWGGSVRLAKRSGVNQVSIFIWLLSGDRARHFLRSIYPFLSVRRKQQIERCPGTFESVETKRLAPEMGDVIVRPAQECAETDGNDLSLSKPN